MGKIKIIFIVIILLACFTSCLIVKSTKDGFRKTAFCYSNSNTNLNKHIKLNGYYEYIHEYTTSVGYPAHKSIVRGPISFLFYPNGMFIAEFQKNNSEYYNPGSYIVQGDTIKTLHTELPSNQTHSLIYTWFKIINDTTLEYLAFSYDKQIDTERIKTFKTSSVEDMLGTFSNAHFIQLDTIPNQDILWIKNKKWFWCNKQQYNYWKAKLK
jgi:hypothetical protein